MVANRSTASVWLAISLRFTNIHVCVCYSKMCCHLNVQVIPTGAAGARTSAVSHPVSLSGTGDAIRPEVASKDGLVSSRNGPTLAEDSTSSGHAQEGSETAEAEMRGP